MPAAVIPDPGKSGISSQVVLSHCPPTDGWEGNLEIRISQKTCLYTTSFKTFGRKAMNKLITSYIFIIIPIWNLDYWAYSFTLEEQPLNNCVQHVNDNFFID